ncbi:cytochrome c biogenesis protein ResB [Breznakiella homolactica]|uniref:Cytochrome c biogenesis protein ResB n=2 Tax=Breznakiella homolactica TaxID=2798577 RepID=A0A7T7XRY9_9SPIR|nr:cytochrome c biogenesis protein ResB [Breznakiella homolactica]
MPPKKGGIFRKIFAALRSLRFTIIIIAYIVVAGAVSTLIPQNMDTEYYYSLYSPGLARFITVSGLSHFFSSPAFLVPVGLFFINLLACTLFRFTRELKKKSGRNFGPDILHGGLILFIIAASLSVYHRMDGSVMLAVGQSVILPNGDIMTLEDFEFQKYEDGRPRAWISYVTVSRNGESYLESHPLEVNRPLKLDAFSLYQVSYGNMGGRDYSVIQAVGDPGYTFVVVSLIITGIGIFVTFIPKLRKRKS